MSMVSASASESASVSTRASISASDSASASASGSQESHVHLLDRLIRIAKPELGPVRSAGLVIEEPLEALGPHKPRQQVCQLHLATRVSSPNFPAFPLL